MKKLLVLSIFVSCCFSTISAITARQITNRIIQKIAGNPYTQTVDVFKEGNPDDEVKGISVCMFATMDVLREAVKNNTNLIITHEPLYYNHLDATEQFKDDPVFTEKRKYIRDNHLIVWRFHDYLHSIKPDFVMTALAHKLGWEKYALTPAMDQFKIPENNLKDIIDLLKKQLPGVSLNVTGNFTTKISNVLLSPGAPGSSNHIMGLNWKKADLIIGGEAQQWETYEYVRDAVSQGKNKSIIFLGHIPSEDPGIEACVPWLRDLIKEVPINFIECGPSYKTF